MADTIVQADADKLNAAVATRKAALAASEPTEAAKLGGKFREVAESTVASGASGPLKVRVVSYEGPQGNGATLEARFEDADGVTHVRTQNVAGPETYRDAAGWSRVVAPS